MNNKRTNDQQQQHTPYKKLKTTHLYSQPTNTSSSSSIYSYSYSSPLTQTRTYNQQSPLVSADLQNYGRVAIKKEALIDQLGFEAAQRAIQRARRRTVHRDHDDPPTRVSTTIQSPQTISMRSRRIKNWLDSPDHLPLPHSLNTRGRDLLDTLTRLAEAGTQKKPSGATEAETDPQSTFWSPVKPAARRPRKPHGPAPSARAFFEATGAEGRGPALTLERAPSPPRILKPGANLHQAFLSLAPSPALVVSQAAAPDENCAPAARPPQARARSRSKNDFSPQSPAPPRSPLLPRALNIPAPSLLPTLPPFISTPSDYYSYSSAPSSDPWDFDHLFTLDHSSSLLEF